VVLASSAGICVHWRSCPAAKRKRRLLRRCSPSGEVASPMPIHVSHSVVQGNRSLTQEQVEASEPD